MLLHIKTNRNIERPFSNAYFLQIVSVSCQVSLFFWHCLFGDDVFEKALYCAWREEALKTKSPPGNVFCLRNNFFVGRLAVFSGEGSIAMDTFFTSALSLSLSLLATAERGWPRGQKPRLADTREKPFVGIEGQERAKGRYYPSQNKPTRVTHGNYPGHTLHRRGNIELDVTVARATRRVLVRGFEHAYVAFMSVRHRFYAAFFLRWRDIAVDGHRFLHPELSDRWATAFLGWLNRKRGLITTFEWLDHRELREK